jgi:hypothetical protein
VSALAVTAPFGGGFWAGSSQSRASTATPQVLSGTVMEVGGGGDEFAVCLSGTTQCTSYGFDDGIPWQDAQGNWHLSVGGPIACMKPLSHGQKITFGVVDFDPVGSVEMGGSSVVWIECSQ